MARAQRVDWVSKVSESPSVVLVEDSLPYATLVSVILRDALPAGVEVRHHETLAAALADLAENDADCVLLDLSLPDAEGLEGLARLQAAGVLASVVVLSGREDEGVALEALRAGAQDYLHKGDERQPDVFGRAIRYAIARSRAQRLSEALLLAQEDRWRSLTQHAPVGIVETDADGTCLFVNERFTEITGLVLEDLAGDPWARVFGPDELPVVALAAERAIAGDGEFSVVSRLVDGDGALRDVHVTGVVHRGVRGGLDGWLGTIVDITEARSAARRLHRAESRFRVAFDRAPIGMALLDPDGALVDVNRSFLGIVGRAREDVLGSDLTGLSAAEDRALWTGHATALAGGASGAGWEQRLAHGDGHAVWVRISVSAVRDEEDGGIVHAVAQVEDIGERRAAEVELQRQQLDMLAVAALARDAGQAEDPVHVLAVGVRRLLGADEAVLALDGGLDALLIRAVDGAEVPPGHAVPLSDGEAAVVQCFRTRERLELRDAQAQGPVSAQIAARSGMRTVVFEPVLRGTDAYGVLAIGWRTVQPELNARQGVLLRLAAAELAAAIDRGRLLDRLRDLARTDPLTGLPNRRAWEERLGVEVARSERAGTPLCVAMLDLDRFKIYNDAHGHPAGDRLLRATAASWQGSLRTGDLLARLGGDEFAVLLPDTDLDGAQTLFMRLQQVTGPEVGCSIGVVRLARGEDAAALLSRADGALYAAKQDGRGGIVSA